MDQSLNKRVRPREAEGRKYRNVPEAWRPPEHCLALTDRPGWSHRWVRLSTLGLLIQATFLLSYAKDTNPAKQMNTLSL
jgi:hypothetical protein